MVEHQHNEVIIIIGSGAGGGTLTHGLAPSGKRVLTLERGDYLPRERDNWDSTAVFVRGTYRAPEFWHDKDGNEFPPEVNYYVGGNTTFYDAALFRLRPTGPPTRRGPDAPQVPPRADSCARNAPDGRDRPGSTVRGPRPPRRRLLAVRPSAGEPGPGPAVTR